MVALSLFLFQATAAAKVKQNSSTSDSQLPAKTQKILDEKNDLILKMREEIKANFQIFSSSGAELGQQSNFAPTMIICQSNPYFFFFEGDEDDNKRPYRRRVLLSVGSCSKEKHLDGGSGGLSLPSDKTTISHSD